MIARGCAGFAMVTMLALSACQAPGGGQPPMDRGTLEPAPSDGPVESDGAASRGAADPEGASAEEIARQMERDLEEFQRMMAARQAGASRGGDSGGGAGVSASTARLEAPSVDRTPARGGATGSAAINGPHTGSGGPSSGGPSNAPVADSGPPVAATDAGSPARSVVPTADAIAAAAAALYRDATRADSPMRSLMALAALSIADPDRPFNPDALTDITEEERRTLSSFHAFCRELGRRLASSDDSEEVVRAVEQLAREMRGERRLRIPRAEFCMSVEGFGNFARIEPREFVAHSAARFVLYFEIDGHRSVEITGEGWKTELSIELSILAERDGVPVWRRDWQTIVDVAASQRKDFFVTHIVAVPDALSVGAYVLKIRVRDEQTGALAERAVPFRMVAAAVSSPPAAGSRP